MYRIAQSIHDVSKIQVNRLYNIGKSGNFVCCFEIVYYQNGEKIVENTIYLPENIEALDTLKSLQKSIDEQIEHYKKTPENPMK
jgi:hypothetical protein